MDEQCELLIFAGDLALRKLVGVLFDTNRSRASLVSACSRSCVLVWRSFISLRDLKASDVSPS